MATRLPHCAFCGHSLACSARVIVEFRLTGAPSVGWHERCTARDPLFRTHVQKRARGSNPVRLVRAVLGRGVSRIAARSAFFRSEIARIPVRAVQPASEASG